jgi:hypothetical protein
MRKLVPLLALVVAALVVPAVTTGTSKEKTWLAGCIPAEQPKFKPNRVILACADANAQIAKIDWAHWGADHATGKGTGKFNDCTPSCAEGHFKSYPANVRAFRPRHCDRAQGKREFTRFRYVFPEDRPDGYRKENIQVRPCSG